MKFSEGEELPQGHPAYDSNLIQAEDFVNTFSKHLLPGMRLYLTKATLESDIDKRILFIGYVPKSEEKLGSYVNPISLHQNRDEFKKEFMKNFNYFHKFAKEMNKIYG